MIVCERCTRSFGTHTQKAEHVCATSLEELLEKLLISEYGEGDWSATGSVRRIALEVSRWK